METMCPDRQIVSVYFDNELDSPWKEKMEAHLASCPRCRSALESYRTARQALSAPADSLLKAAGQRVWERLEDSAESRRGYGAGTFRRKPGAFGKFWRGRITVPFPVAAAACLVLAAAFALFLALGPESPPQMADMGMEVQTSPIGDMAGLLEYLNSDNSPDMVIIRLPETATFTSSGEPRVIRAADYSRNNQKR